MKRLLLLTVLFAFSFYGFSQEEETQTVQDSTNVQTRESTSYGLKYGVRGGFTISHLDFERQPPMDNKHRNSMYVGFFANIGLSRTLSLAPELQFSAEGANDETLHLDYIQMPVMLRLRINEKFHIGLGPQMGVKVHKADDGFKNLAYSAVAGIDYKINYALFADFRYNYGIRNVFDEATGIVAKNRNIQLGVGYKF